MKVSFVGAGNMAARSLRGWAAASGEPGAPAAMLFSDADRDRRGTRGGGRRERRSRERRAGG